MIRRLFMMYGFMLFLCGCSSANDNIHTEFITDACIKPFIDYRYLTCNKIVFLINSHKFVVPQNFETDLASIPKIAWPLMAPAHSSLIRPAIVHDWLYRESCYFNRKHADLIFYHMLRNDGISYIKASTMYYAVRMLGWNFYNKEYCNDRRKSMDKETRRIKITSIFGYRG